MEELNELEKHFYIVRDWYFRECLEDRHTPHDSILQVLAAAHTLSTMTPKEEPESEHAN